jgi:hypothetical protein
MANELTKSREVFNAIAQADGLANLPREHKTAMQRIFERAAGGKIQNYLDEHGVVVTGAHASALGHLARDGSEGLLVGAGFGYVDAKMGLDVGPVPVDLATAALAGAGSVALGAHAIGHEMRNITTASLTVFGFRKMKTLIAKKQAASASKMAAAGEDYEQDPVLRVAKTIK